MAKPGIKEIEENKYKLDTVGVLQFKDNEIRFDISEMSDGTEVINVKEYFDKMNGELVKLSLIKKDVVES